MIVDVCAWVLAVALLAWTVLRLGGWERGTPLVQLVSFTPYVAVLAVLATVGVAVTGRWAAALGCGVAAGLLLALVVPRAIATSAHVASSDDLATLRVMTANLLSGRADAVEVVRLVKVEELDVLAVQELTFDCLDGLDAAGIGDLLPYRVANPTERWEGSAVFSRHPLDAGVVRTLPTGHSQVAAVVALPGRRAVQVESAHPCAPQRGYTRQWKDGLTTQPAASDGALPRILLGDFNATLDHGPLRRLLATGYRDAAAERGAGLVPTWPFLQYRVPWVTLDHVLVTDPVTVVSVAVRPIPGSDHRAVVAELRI